MFLSIALFVFIYSQHACANVRFVKIHRHPPCPPPQKRQAERRALSLGGRNAGRASELRKRALDLMGKQGAARTLVKTPSSKRVSPPGAKHTQWKPLIMRAVGPREPFCMLHSQSDHRTNCVYPAHDIT